MLETIIFRLSYTLLLLQTLGVHLAFAALDDTSLYLNRNFTFEIPPAGFFTAITGGSAYPTAFRALRRINSPGFCHTIKFTNLPEPNYSPFVGSNEFILQEDKFVNGHYAWYNGAEYLSYVIVEGREHGNWIIGGEAGVDKGYVYLSTRYPAAVPINLEQADDTNFQWHWLMKGIWEKQPQVKTVCTDAYMPGLKYYEIEYFDKSSGAGEVSFLVPDMHPVMRLSTGANSVAGGDRGTVKDFSAAAMHEAGFNQLTAYPAYYHKATNSWIGLEDIKPAVKFGTPVLISSSIKKFSYVAVLVNSEHSGKMGWRLTFRNFPFSKKKKAGAASSSGGIESQEQVALSNDGTASMIYEVTPRAVGTNPSSNLAGKNLTLERTVDGHRHVTSKSNRNIQTIQTAPFISQISHYPDFDPKSNEEEYVFEFGDDGFEGDFEISPLTAGVRRSFQRTMQHIFEHVQPGEYVWMWYTRLPTTKRALAGHDNVKELYRSMDSAVTATTVGAAAGGAPATGGGGGGLATALHNKLVPHTESVVELLLQCHARTADTIIFRYFEEHRMHVMRQSVLEKDTDFLVVHCSQATSLSTAAGVGGGGGGGVGGGDDGSGSGCNKFIAPVILFRGQPILVNSMINLGSDILDYLWRHLEDKEGAAGGLSSCYMYHAAVSMPQPLIYAAEILCVLMGAKPVAMVQYVTPTEHQWKFPLVPELCQAIVAAKALLGASLDISYDVFKYRKDESFIIYRTGRKYIADGLLPAGQAQALHPVPYPESDNLDADWKLQIYNSAWNGFILGYPEFFVESYCETFHNGLGVEQKRVQVQLAKRQFEMYLETHNFAKYFIHIGLDPPVDKRDYNVIKRLMSSR